MCVFCQAIGLRDFCPASIDPVKHFFEIHYLDVACRSLSAPMYHIVVWLMGEYVVHHLRFLAVSVSLGSYGS